MKGAGFKAPDDEAGTRETLGKRTGHGFHHDLACSVPLFVSYQVGFLR